MIILKTLETKYLKLEIMITHHGLHNHERINASMKSIEHFNEIIDDMMTGLKDDLVIWEIEHKDKIEQVGK